MEIDEHMLIATPILPHHSFLDFHLLPLISFPFPHKSEPKHTNFLILLQISHLSSMAATSSTPFSPTLYPIPIKPHLKWNPLFHKPSPLFPIKPSNKTLQFKCFFTNKNQEPLKFELIGQKGTQKSPKDAIFAKDQESPKFKLINQKGIQKTLKDAIFANKNQESLKFELINQKGIQKSLKDSILKAFNFLKKPAMVAILMGLLVMYDPRVGLAASGGRAGGRSFSSRSSTSSSRSYSVPRTGGLGAPGYSFSAPYYAPSPFGFGGGGVYVGPAVGFGSSFVFIMVSVVAFTLVSGFLSDRDGSEGVLSATDKTTVVKLQVGLLGMARSLQMDLNRIAEAADTSSPEGLHFLLTETILALLRHPDFCISAYSSVDVKRSVDEGERRFNQLSIEERGKFDEETLVNVNNIRKQTGSSQRATGFSNEYIVITILVAAEGVHKLPTINSSGDLKDALQKLASIPSSRTMAVEVLWTPQSENDTLSERELIEDYPMLRPL